MKMLILTAIILGSALCSISYGQAYSSISYQTSSSLVIGSGADVCATEIIINGAYSGGGTICSGPLPVTMLAFTASTHSNNITLSWETGAEINNSGFTVERKLDKENEVWKSITFIRGSGTTNEPVSYSFEDKKLNSGTYQYRLKQIDFNGNYEYFSLSSHVIIKAPLIFTLSQNYPNPSNPSSKIDFQLPIGGRVTIKVFDASGKEVATILNDFLSADFHTATFNGTNFASGVYFYTLTSGDFIKTNKMILVK